MSDTTAFVELPTLLVAMRVKGVADNISVGVPEITHVEAFTDSVPGKLPAFVLPDLIPQAVTEAPLIFNVVGVTDMT